MTFLQCRKCRVCKLGLTSNAFYTLICKILLTLNQVELKLLIDVGIIHTFNTLS